MILTIVLSDLPKAVEEYAHRYDTRHSLLLSISPVFPLALLPLLPQIILVLVSLSTLLLLLVETLRCSGP